MNGALQDIVNYFSVRAATSDVSNALQMTSFITSIAVLLVQVLGLTGIAIWIGRIAIDMLLIAGRGLPGFDRLTNLGTGESDSYQSVTSYLSKNLLNILITVVLIVFFATGWIFKLFAIAIQGTGAILARIMNLDVGRLYNRQEVEAYKTNIQSSRSTEVLTEYDDAVAAATGYLDTLYSMKDIPNDNPDKQAIMREYTNEIYRADAIVNGRESELSKALNKNDKYFQRHKELDVTCNSAFFISEVGSLWSTGGGLSCGQ